jgi:hypothetical protein
VEAVGLAKTAIYDDAAREMLRENVVERYDAIKKETNHLNNSTKEFEREDI